MAQTVPVGLTRVGGVAGNPSGAPSPPVPRWRAPYRAVLNGIAGAPLAAGSASSSAACTSVRSYAPSASATAYSCPPVV
ncbi:MAG: hypothetical protein AUG44_02960 [Actinobacteria bacterium 13_1_20CM_3_71_11]|nr:MAG: hypothetical protein AUG44_02960 [Actinobacteria bacterium 13_1_20CM_3_71_11]